MNRIANVANWHRYLLALLGIAAAILTGVAADPGIVPPALQPELVYVPLALLVEGAIVAGLPRAQLPTGPGAPDVISPPAKLPVEPPPR